MFNSVCENFHFYNIWQDFSFQIYKISDIFRKVEKELNISFCVDKFAYIITLLEHNLKRDPLEVQNPKGIDPVQKTYCMIRDLSAS